MKGLIWVETMVVQWVIEMVEHLDLQEEEMLEQKMDCWKVFLMEKLMVNLWASLKEISMGVQKVVKLDNQLDWKLVVVMGILSDNVKVLLMDMKRERNLGHEKDCQLVGKTVYY